MVKLEKVEKIYNKYKKFIWEEIPKETKLKWKVKTIKFKESNEKSWSAQKNGTILVGNYYKSLSKILTSIIHESIHINTSRIFKKTFKKEAIAREIATCILTNKIIRKANKKFGKRFRKNRFDDWYRKYEEKSKKFERKGKNKNFYEFCEMIKKDIK